MAGFLAWVRLGDTVADVTSALACLRHHPSFQGQVLAGDQQVGAAAVYRPDDPPEVFADRERDLVVVVLGAVLEHRNEWHRYTAHELAATYWERGLRAMSGHDGAYLILIWDGRMRRVHLLNDRVGSLPVQYARVEEGVAFAPEAKALFRLLPLKPRMDVTGTVSFLNLGYPVGTHTLFEGVRMLAPGHALTLDLSSGELTLARTWTPRFEPDEGLRLVAAAGLLHEAILDAHRAPLGRSGERSQLALTGGYDSRLVLGTLVALGSPPTQAVTWGATDQVPGTDVTLARELARIAGVPHRFRPYDAAGVAAHAREWCVISELASDNLGFYAAGPRFLYDAAVPTGAVYVGEHVIGPGGLPRTVEEAIETVTLVPTRGLVPTISAILTPAGREQAGGILWRELEAMVGDCPSSRPKDVQDHLFLQLDAFRWLFSPSFYKEPMMTVRRPLFLGPVLEVTTRLPESFRVDKRVLVTLLERFLPDLMRPPLTRGNSLPDWEYESRQMEGFGTFLRERTRPGTLATLPVAEFLDMEAVRTLLGAFFQELPHPIDRRGDSIRFWVTARRRLMSVPVMGKALGWIQPSLRRWRSPRVRGAVRPFRLVFRLALLSLFGECIASGEFDARAGRCNGGNGTPGTHDGRGT